jgi:hypothetical protein
LVDRRRFVLSAGLAAFGSVVGCSLVGCETLENESFILFKRLFLSRG